LPTRTWIRSAHRLRIDRRDVASEKYLISGCFKLEEYKGKSAVLI
jgi:hypothetical protein